MTEVEHALFNKAITIHTKIKYRVTQTNAQGEVIKEEDEARLSPLGRKHINFLGHFSFMLPKVVTDGQLRPLNLKLNPNAIV